MASETTLELSDRSETEVGSAACVRMRRAGRTPGVLYGRDAETIAVSVTSQEIESLVNRGVRVLDISIGAEAQKALIRDVQWNIFGTSIYHFDLMRIDKDQRIEIELLIELRGTAAGTTSGGSLEQQLHSVRIECPAIAVPDSLQVPIGDLEIDDVLTVADLELPDGVEALLPPETTVVRVVEIRDEEEEVEGDDLELDVSAAEPEVIGRSTDDEESEDDDGDDGA